MMTAHLGRHPAGAATPHPISATAANPNNTDERATEMTGNSRAASR
jgi:hypothetical protein